jgi:hypothetical protein
MSKEQTTRIYHEYFARLLRLEELRKVTRPRTKVHNGVEFAFDVLHMNRSVKVEEIN